MTVTVTRATLNRAWALLEQGLAGTAIWSVRAVVLIALCGGLLWTVLAGWTGLELLAQPAASGWFMAPWLLAVAATFAGCVHLARRQTPLPPAAFVIVALIAGVALRGLYIVVVEPTWINDFERYWQAALRLAAADRYLVDGIYEQRALPVLVPLIELFGNSPVVVKIFNLVLLTLTQVAGYDLLRRVHSHQAAQSFTLLWLVVPETTFSVTIPSHDLVGMALLALVFWLNVVATDPQLTGLRRGVATAALALAMAYLEAARNLGIFLCLVFALAGAAGWLLARARPALFPGIGAIARTTLVQSLVAFASIQLMLAWLASGHYMPSAAEREMQSLRAITPQANSMADGSYAWFRGFNDTFATEMLDDPVAFRQLRNSLNASDYLARPEAVVAKVYERSERMFNLGSQYSFYHAGWLKDHPAGARALQLYNTSFSAVFALLMIVALLRLLTRPGPPQLFLQAIFLAGLVLACLTLLYNQPRYIYPVWFVGACVIAWGLACAPATPRRPGAALRAVARLTWQSAAFAAVALLGLWALLSLWMTDGRGRILDGWHLESHQQRPSPDEALFLASLADRTTAVIPHVRHGHFDANFGPLDLQLEFPALLTRGDTMVARRQVCHSAQRQLAFHVHTPYRRVERQGAFTLELLQDDQVLWSRELPGAQIAESVHVPLRGAGCSELTFRLRANVGYARESWREASRTEIFFPRLVAARATGG